MVAVETAFVLALVAFAGGALGAALGGLRAYGLAGLAVVVGQAASVAEGTVAAAGVGDPAALGTTGITATLGFGPALGPHVAFAGGVAAAAYVGRRGGDDEFEYHEAKHIAAPLGTAPDVLAVGGAFGVVGYALAVGAAAVGVPTDPISLSIVLSALLHRVAFGYPLVGDVRRGLLDMTPYERRERRPRRPGSVAGGEEATDDAATTRYVVEPWLPHQSDWANVTLLGFAVGVFAAFVTYETGSPFLPFGIAAASLLVADRDRFPVTHHMALPAGVVVVALVGAADPTLLNGGLAPAEVASAVKPYFAVLAGGVLGAIAGLTAELAQRTLYAHADTHLDPAAAGIVVSVLLVGLLELTGVVTTGGILPMP